MERRNTIQKELVLSAVKKMHRHVTADEVYDFIKSDYPSIGKGTVYRNLGKLVEENLIKKVEIPDGPDLYDYKTYKHYHVKCIQCGNVFDVDMDEITDLENHILNKHGFQFLDHDIFFKGICPKCQKGEE